MILTIDGELRYELDDARLADMYNVTRPAAFQALVDEWLGQRLMIPLPLAAGGEVAVSWQTIRTAVVEQPAAGPMSA